MSEPTCYHAVVVDGKLECRPGPGPPPPKPDNGLTWWIEGPNGSRHNVGLVNGKRHCFGFSLPMSAAVKVSNVTIDNARVSFYDGHALKADEPIQIERQGNGDERPTKEI